MTDKEWKKLKSGTDIRGVAVETEIEKIELTDDVVKQVVFGFIKWYGERFGTELKTIAVGHDSRISASRIKNAATEVLLNFGVKVYDCSLSSTPSMFMTIVTDIKCDASLEITASHHPYQRNGLKFFTKNGGLEGEDVERILSIASEEKYVSHSADKECIKYDFMSVYCKQLREMIISETGKENPLDGLKIIVDAGNGAGGFYAENVLKPLGADISGSVFLEPDGMFPNHIPNPENKTAMDFASKATLNAKADLGIIFDTDVDRMGCIDSKGNEINRNKLVALASVIALENYEGGWVVTDSLTSDGLRSFIEKDLKSHQLRFKRGYKNVINKSIELNNNGICSPLAIETSGHAAFKENYFLDDGAYLATKIVIKLAQLKEQGKSLENLIASLEEPKESVEIRIPIIEEDFKSYGNRVIDKLIQSSEKVPGWSIEKENYEGVRINTEDGWFLLRLSVHDPILPLNIECNNSCNSESIANKIKSLLMEFGKLDLSGFDK